MTKTAPVDSATGLRVVLPDMLRSSLIGLLLAFFILTGSTTALAKDSNESALPAMATFFRNTESRAQYEAVLAIYLRAIAENNQRVHYVSPVFLHINGRSVAVNGHMLAMLYPFFSAGYTLTSKDYFQLVREFYSANTTHKVPSPNSIKVRLDSLDKLFRKNFAEPFIERTGGLGPKNTRFYSLFALTSGGRCHDVFF
jgi:hypothetical protein